jgi:hypothetical protein
MGAAELEHEILDHSVEVDPVIELVLHQRDEVACSHALRGQGVTRWEWIPAYNLSSTKEMKLPEGGRWRDLR